MLEKTFPNLIVADPSKFSFRGEALELEEVQGEDKVFVDKATGERFHLLEGEYACFERLESLIFKGVVNVSDIVKVGGAYYSHEQNLDQISKADNSFEEIKADIYLLELITGDEDHDLINRLSRYFGSNEEHHNVRFDKEGSRFNYFDFDCSGLDWISMKTENQKKLEGEFVKKIKLDKKPKGDVFFMQIPQNKIFFEILKTKVQKLMALHSSEERFEKIIKESGVKLEPKNVKILFRNINTRLRALTNVLSKY